MNNKYILLAALAEMNSSTMRSEMIEKEKERNALEETIGRGIVIFEPKPEIRLFEINENTKMKTRNPKIFDGKLPTKPIPNGHKAFLICGISISALNYKNACKKYNKTYGNG